MPALVDEDGDEHKYLVVDNMPKKATPSPPVVPLSARKPAPGGYGFFVRETVDEDYEPSEPRSPRSRPAKRKQAARKKTVLSGSSKKTRVASADNIENSSVSKSVAVNPAASTEDDAAVLPAGDSEGTGQAREPGAPDGGPKAAGSNTSTEEAALGNVSADAKDEGESAQDANGDKAPEGERKESNAGVEEQGGLSKARVVIEHAKTPRSVCRICGNSIDKGSVRCGVQGYAGGRTVQLWAHANCFLKNIRADYVTSRRCLCKATGEQIEVGHIRVGFEVGNHKSWRLPAEAARWTSLVVAELGEGSNVLSTVQGLDDINEEHRGPLLELLQTGKAPEIELKRAVASAAKRPRPKAKQPAMKTAANKAPGAADPAASTQAEEEDSDVEVALDAPPPLRPGRAPLDLDSDG
ncbi:unnamed protein product [Symbiodinium pilosum]|uniref:PARP-type domain-containing protein n=1 Tax=Symbiodinium pilosum TaxID=2952 RepID=A0A812J0G8_SYMPI|nr:unnamed protein product [Symbiodinium pilosum]